MIWSGPSDRPSRSYWAGIERRRSLAPYRLASYCFNAPLRFVRKRKTSELATLLFGHPAGALQLAWEPRGDWPPALVAALCRDFDLLHGLDPLGTDNRTVGPAPYWRLHGKGAYSYRYSEEDLQELWHRLEHDVRQAIRIKPFKYSVALSRSNERI